MNAGEKNDQDVSSVDGVFAGWTASDLVGTPADVAALTWAIYGPEPTVLPKARITGNVRDRDHKFTINRVSSIVKMC